MMGKYEYRGSDHPCTVTYVNYKYHIRLINGSSVVVNRKEAATMITAEALDESIRINRPIWVYHDAYERK